MSEPDFERLSPEMILARQGATWNQAEREIVFNWLLQPDRYRQLLFWASRFLGQYATPEDGEDAVGDFLLKQINSVVQRFDPSRASFWSFLISCLWQFCYGLQRKAPALSLVKSRDEETNLELIIDSRVDIHRVLENKEVAAELRQAIKGLPKQSYNVIILRFFQGKKFKAIAKELGIKESAAKVRLFRARQLLAEHIKRPG
jgi:RNA polymerase sigma factor (sigma-70 family)